MGSVGRVMILPVGTRSPDGRVHEFKSGVGYLALHSGCDVLPIHISGTHEVLGKGALIPHRGPVEVRIGRVITNTALRLLAADVEGAGAYRKLADSMRQAVLALVERPVHAAKPTPAPAIASEQPETPSHKDSDVHHRPRKRAKA